MKQSVSVMIWSCIKSKGVGRICMLNVNINKILEYKWKPVIHYLFQDNKFLYLNMIQLNAILLLYAEGVLKTISPTAGMPVNNIVINSNENLKDDYRNFLIGATQQ